MTNKELFYFAGKCIALDDHPEFAHQIIQRNTEGTIPWPEFVNLCSNHLMLPCIYLKFRNHGVLPHLPSELAEFLKDIYQLNLERNNRILDQLNKINRTLNRHSINPIFLKGTAHLLDNLYADPGERMIGDIDLLVPEKDYLRSVQILKEDGYDTNSPVYLDVKNLKHYPGLSKAGEVTHIEIHRLPVAEDYRKWFGPEIIEPEKKQLSALYGCFVLSDRHKIIHNFIHAQLGHKGHINGLVSFRDLYDLHRIAQRVEIKDLLPEMKSRSKAIAYFVFASKALSLKERLYPRDTFSSRILIAKHSLNMNSAIFYNTYRYTVYFCQRLFVGYIGQMIKAVYSKKTRSSVISRLANPRWYKDHLLSYKMFFSPQK